MAATSKGTRLDGLFSLLNAKDANQRVRRLAADQIADVAPVPTLEEIAAVPPALSALVHRLLVCLLQSPVWDARVAAASAVGRLGERYSTVLRAEQPGADVAAFVGLAFAELNVEMILRAGSVLLSSSGREYAAGPVDVQQQWQALRAELFGSGGAAFLDVDIGVDERDIQVSASAKRPRPTEDKSRLPGASADASMAGHGRSRRRAATNVAPLITEDSGLSADEADYSEASSTLDEDDDRPTNTPGAAEEMPQAFFERLLQHLSEALLSSRWESRHGAAAALRELLSRPALRQALSSARLEDLAVRLFIVLAMDRFGDYAFEQVVAPVRETAAMALGALLPDLASGTVASLAECLVRLARDPSDWQVRHGGLLGLRYVLAVRAGQQPQLLSAALPATLEALQSDDDDVLGAACEALALVAVPLLRWPAVAPEEILRTLWSRLGEMEETSSCVPALMRLMEALIRERGADALVDSVELGRLVRLLRHPAPDTRRAVVFCLRQYLAHRSGEPERDLLDALFTLSLWESEQHADIVAAAAECWRLALRPYDAEAPCTGFAAADEVGCRRHPFTIQLWQVACAHSPREAVAQLWQYGRGALAGSSSLRERVEDTAAAGVRMHLRAASLLAIYGVAHGAATATTTEDETPKWLTQMGASRSLVERRLACWVVRECGNAELARALCEPALEATAELAAPLSAEASRLLGTAFTAQVAAMASAVAPTETGRAIAALDDTERVRLAVRLCTTDYERYAAPNPEIRERLAALRLQLLSSIGRMRLAEATLRHALSASAVGSLASCGVPLPARVGPWIKALMAVLTGQVELRAATDAEAAAPEIHPAEWPAPLCQRAAEDLARLVRRLPLPGKARDQVVKNLITAECAVALRQLAIELGAELFSSLPQLEREVFFPSTTDVVAQRHRRDVAIQSICDCVDPKLDSRLLALLPQLIAESSDAVAPLCAAHPAPGMQAVIHHLLPRLAPSGAAAAAASIDPEQETETRLAAVRALSQVVDRLGTALIPYAAFLVAPVLSRMVDADLRVRTASCSIFGTLVRLLPLEAGVADEPDASEAFRQERRVAREFIGQLLGARPPDRFELRIPVADGVRLRDYQQDGLDWLAFLHRFGLHGALCDDMGLGKTLMTLCMMAADRYAELHDMLAVVGEARDAPTSRRLPSLVICPASVMHHWHDEALRFFPQHLTPVLVYGGPPPERVLHQQRWRESVSGDAPPALLITSYEIARSDAAFLSGIAFSYVVLDEGHMIKNAKTKVSQAVRALNARHRLILTGTPIQNSVLELWALFDFLLPGFLGTEESFNAVYAKPILASRNPRCSEAVREAGEVAMAQLHRQVLPFILRRMKEDVLRDLPPKVIQDYYCELSAVQRFLYDEFARQFRTDLLGDDFGAQASRAADDDELAPTDAPMPAKQHIFAALMYMRRLCSHPRLVLKSQSEAQRAHIKTLVRGEGLSLHSLEVAPKLLALRDLLWECGIAQAAASAGAEGGADGGGAGAAQHRVLIFAQLKEMLDVIEDDLFRRHLPAVTYLRLDGGVEPRRRQDIVNRFNADPTIDCLLLTTHVGGLGLNLTGADTVIFVESDYNPTVDLQAMDRAHRIGQRRTVTVYRIITRGTIEEKIMGIQRFKTHLANTVVNRENASLQLMHASELLDLFRGAEMDEGKHRASEATTTEGLRRAPKRGRGVLPAWQSMPVDADAEDGEEYGDEFRHTAEFVDSLLQHGQKERS